MTPAGLEFCCGGCASAFTLVHALGLEKYYQRRTLDPGQRLTRPEPLTWPRDLSAWVRPDGKDRCRLDLVVDGLHCGACMWLIEQALLRQPGIVAARVSLATRRLAMSWKPAETSAEKLVAAAEALGYRLTPAVAAGPTGQDAEGRRLLLCLAVAGFAAGNIMLFSVSVWSGGGGSIAPATRDLFHWLSALIAIPAIAYAGRPFFASALAVLRARRTNMDVPISLAVILAPAVSLYETFASGQHAYFDSAVTLLFFLLVGRYLDHRARRQARQGAEHLLAIAETPATIIEPDGARRDVPPRELQPGMTVLVAPGSRVPVDGSIVEGMSDLDASLVSGESAPRTVAAGSRVFAGTLNLTGPLRVLVDRAGDTTLLADIIRLIEASETRHGGHVRIADRVARYYSPVVHAMALASFLGWTVIGAMVWQEAVMIAVSVLIITCPCALALAVPVVQAVASQRLMRAGILLKNGEALERLASIDHVVLDKTGTLTLGRLSPVVAGEPGRMATAAAIAANSRHPLARALAAAWPVARPASPVEERPGQGLIWRSPVGEWRLGSAEFAGSAGTSTAIRSLRPCVVLRGPDGRLDRFEFEDRLRPDAREACAALGRQLGVEILSGDGAGVVAPVARAVGVATWRAGATPRDKADRLDLLAAQGRKVLMVGDGLNDAPSLALASVSMAPSTGADLAQVRADIVFQGDRLAAVPFAVAIARSAGRLMRQNLVLALVYNLAAVPLAVLGLVTPLVAALAMSSSSILVVANSMRLGRQAYPSGEEN